MNRLDALLSIVLLLELGVGVLLFTRRETSPRPPLPVLVLSNSLRSDFEDLVTNCKTTDDWHELAAVYTAYGFYSEAVACYDVLLKRQPNDPELLFESGFLLSQMGRWSDAHLRFSAALAAGHPAPADCWYFIGRNYLRAEQPDQAADSFAQAGDLVSAQLELARLCYRGGDAKGAMTLLQPVLAKEPDKIAPNALAYLCSLELEDPHSAAQYAERAADTTERIYSPFYTQWERLEAAIPLVGYRRRFAEAQEYAQKNRFDRAEALWQEARRIEWNEFSVFGLVQLAKLQGDHQRVIDLLQEMIDRRGPSTEVLVELADSYAALNDISRSIDVASQAIEAQSEENLEQVFRRLAEWSEALGRTEDAQRYAELQVLWRGKAAFWMADWETAEFYLTSASKRMEQSDEAWFFLAETYRRRNKNAEATAAYQRCQSLNPLHGGAHRGMAMLDE